MIFRFVAPTMSSFYNQGVPIPLSIAWFDAAGVFVGSAEMATCGAACPTFHPAVPYELAVEVPAGGLHRLGIGPGSALLVGGSCGA
jgi:uncharacterized membrane protein (UPF0127 family)